VKNRYLKNADLAGGNTDEILTKVNGTDLNTQWQSFLSLFQKAIIAAPVFANDLEAAELPPYTFYKTATGELRYKVNPLNEFFLDVIAGNDADNGYTPLTPKLSKSAIDPLLREYSKLNIKKDTSVFGRFSLDNNASLQSYGSGGLSAIITGARKVVNSDITPTPNTSNVYQFTYECPALSQIGYDYPFPIFIDKTSEINSPFSSRLYPNFVSDIEAVDLKPNTFTYTKDGSSVTIYFHPTESILNTTKYRYEVTQLSNNISSRDAMPVSISNIILRDCVDGYGSIDGGIDFTAEKVVIQGGGTHLGVVKQGLLNYCLLLPGMKGGTPGDIGVVFYSDSGAGLSCAYKNVLVFDMSSAFYIHTGADHSPSTDYEELTYENCYAFNVKVPFGGANVASIIITSCYAENSGNFFLTNVNSSLIDKCIVNGTDSGFALISNFDYGETKLLTVQNTFVKKNGRKDALDNPAQNVFTTNQPGFKISAKNNLLFFYNRTPYSAQYMELDAFGGGCHELETKYNIVVIDCDNAEGDQFPNYYQMVLGNDTNTITYQDYNVYILLRGNPIWLSFNSSQGPGDQGIYSYAVWKTTGHDANSLFLDFRNTPERINEIFADYANGDWTLLDGELTDSIRAVVGNEMEAFFPTQMPEKPTYEAAYEIINNATLSEPLVL